MTANSRKVLLLGASVRAMAQSVIRGGDVPICIDLFGDMDLRAVAETRILPRNEYPEGFIEAARAFPGIPRIYSGGLENHPQVIAALAETGPVWGCGAETLERVRDPNQLSRLADPPYVVPPVVVFDSEGIPTDGSWLCKPKRGSAGIGIRPWTGGALRDGELLQERVEGVPHSAAFIGRGEGARLVGVSLQLVGCDWCNAPPFAYCGSIGPVPTDEAGMSSVAAMGERIVGCFGVRGWFGVDFMWDGGAIRPVEINPRYTASTEVHERAAAFRLYEEHRAAFVAEPPQQPRAPRRVVGKAIVYAGRRCTFEGLPPRTPASSMEDLELADVPATGTTFDVGEPIVSVLVSSSNVDSCRSQLVLAAAEVRRALADRGE